LRVVVVVAVEQKATAAGDVCMHDARRLACRLLRFKPILTTSWFGNKVNDVLLVLQLKVIAPTRSTWKYAFADVNDVIISATPLALQLVRETRRF